MLSIILHESRFGGTSGDINNFKSYSSSIVGISMHEISFFTFNSFILLI